MRFETGFQPSGSMKGRAGSVFPQVLQTTVCRFQITMSGDFDPKGAIIATLWEVEGDRQITEELARTLGSAVGPFLDKEARSSGKKEDMRTVTSRSYPLDPTGTTGVEKFHIKFTGNNTYYVRFAYSGNQDLFVDSPYFQIFARQGDDAPFRKPRAKKETPPRLTQVHPEFEPEELD